MGTFQNETGNGPGEDLEIGRDDRYRHLVESISDYAIFLLDPGGYIQSWNLGAERLKQYTASEIIGQHFSIFYTPEDIDRNHPERELLVVRSAGRYEEEGWRVRKDGTRFWANVIITRLVDEQGKITGFAKVTRDLTQRKLTEERLRLSEERFRLLVTAVKDYAICMLDSEGKVATWNEGILRLKGYTAPEILGEHFSKFYPEEDIRAGRPAWEIEEAVLTGRFEDEGWRVRKDGTRFWASVILTAMRNDAGELIGFSKVTRDITDRRRLEEKLRRSNEELDQRVQERTAQLKRALHDRDEFMGIVSHELRTPVTSLKLQVQMALRDNARGQAENFAERSIKFIASAGRQLDRLASLIDDMLDVSRISMDRLKLTPENLEVAEMIAETVERFEAAFRNGGRAIQIDLQAGLQIHGDRLRLEQVLANLVTNALKYGGDQGIRIETRAEGDEVAIAVHDQGVGIGPEDLERIFECFERAATAANVSGMGLGLYISRKIVDAHRGRIAVRSELGRGSTFTVYLPRLV